MNHSIEQILSNLGDCLTQQLCAANGRAAAAETQYELLLNGVQDFIQANQKPLIDETPPTSPAAPVMTSKAGSVSDEMLLAALTSEWIGAGKLRQLLREQGLTLSEGSIYNRMRKLATARRDLIDAAAKPERWRIKTSTSCLTNEKSMSVAAKVSKLRPATPAEGCQLAATNDNATPTILPRLHHGDCLEVMQTIADQSVDLVLADLPYGTTRCEGDIALPLDRLWNEYRRILRPLGAVVLFSTQPFTTALINSNPEWFKYALVWEKNVPSGFLHVANKPMKVHEDILVFSPGTTIHAERSKRRMTYNPQGVVSAGLKKVKARRSTIRYLGQDRIHREGLEYEAHTGYPRSILRFPKDADHLHPFQKPTALLEYLIKTYSQPGATVLDNTMGSGSTCVAAVNTGRCAIGIEKDEKWFKIAEQRVADATPTCSPSGTNLPITPPALLAAVPISNDNEEGQAARRPAHQSAGVTLYQGDCLEVMRSMPSESTDLVVTSPPYNLGAGSGGLKSNRKNTLWKNAALADGYASYDDARDPAEYVEWQKEVLRECWRLLKPDGAIFYQHKPRGQNKVLQTPLDLNPNLPVRQIIIWNRKSGFAFNDCYFLPTHEWIVIFAKEDFRLTRGGKNMKDVWDIPFERNNPHPAPFPVEIPRRAIQATSAKVILDPFMGSGTTGVAAMQCGREFVGIELDPGYLAGAANRIEAERPQPRRVVIPKVSSVRSR